jgi:N-acetylmuramoyl-L-alanine amidase
MSKKILLDPGHGGKDSGALGGGWQEKDINLEAALYIGNRLETLGFTVGYTRTGDTFPGETNERGIMAKGYDYFLSIHCNAGGGSGAEVYCNTRETYAYTEIALRDALRPLVGWRKIASRRYDNGVFVDRSVDDATRKFTSAVQATDWYGVLRGCWSVGVSGDLLEMFFIDNATDRAVFDADRQRVYEAIVKALCTAFGVAYKAPKAVALPAGPDYRALYEKQTVELSEALRERDTALTKLAAVRNIVI